MGYCLVVKIVNCSLECVQSRVSWRFTHPRPHCRVQCCIPGADLWAAVQLECGSIRLSAAEASIIPIPFPSAARPAALGSSELCKEESWALNGNIWLLAEVERTLPLCYTTEDVRMPFHALVAGVTGLNRGLKKPEMEHCTEPVALTTRHAWVCPSIDQGSQERKFHLRSYSNPALMLFLPVMQKLFC